MSKYNRKRNKNNIDEVSVNVGVQKQLMIKSKTTIKEPALELEKYDKSNIVATNSQQNAKNGFIEGLKILTDLFPLISGMIIASIVIAQIFYANIAEQYYHIEKSLFFTELVYDKLLNVGEFAILNLLFLLLAIVIYNIKHEIHLLFYVLVFLISCAVLSIGLYAYAESISQGIYPADDVNRITLCILKYPLVFIFLLSFLGTMGFWIMLNNIVLSYIAQKIQTLINNKKRLDSVKSKEEEAKETECTNLKSSKIFGYNDGKHEHRQSKIILNTIGLICFICILSTVAVIGVWLWNFILGGVLIINRESYPQKKTYEIVQNNNCPELNTTSEQVASATNFQVVILHRGSQVLLMNGKIDGHEAINPQEDMSSSNLVIDINSYEIQEASQYRFYRKKFNNVTTNPPPKK